MNVDCNIYGRSMKKLMARFCDLYMLGMDGCNKTVVEGQTLFREQHSGVEGVNWGRRGVGRSVTIHNSFI